MVSIARQVKCPECGKLNDKENAVEHKKRYYCKKCLENKQNRVKKSTDGMSELCDYLTKLYGYKPTPRMYQQLADFRKKFDFTNMGMLLTLEYFYDTMGNKTLENNDSLGIIPYVYEDAKTEFIINKEVNNHNEGQKFNDEIKMVKINPTTYIKPKRKISFDREVEVEDE